MLDSISWKEYFALVGSGLMVSYDYLGWRYYQREWLALLPGGRKAEAGHDA